MEKLNLLLDYQKLDIKIGKIESEVKKSDLYKKVVKVRKYLLDSQKLMKKHEVDIVEINKSMKMLLSQYMSNFSPLFTQTGKSPYFRDSEVVMGINAESPPITKTSEMRNVSNSLVRFHAGQFAVEPGRI